MKNLQRSFGIGAVGLATAAVAFFGLNAIGTAQQAEPAYPPMRQDAPMMRPGQGPGQQGPGPMMGGGGAPPTVINDGSYLYILRGNSLLKVAKDDLKVTAQANLPMPMGPRPGGEPARVPGNPNG